MTTMIKKLKTVKKKKNFKKNLKNLLHGNYILENLGRK